MVLMQDNSTSHTARTTQQMLQGHNIRILDWPPCIPDLNPIEHVWDEIDRRVRQLPSSRT
jgi:transposase